jgi:hypothetical protein
MFLLQGTVIVYFIIFFILLCAAVAAAARASIHWLTTLIFIIVSPYVCRVRKQGSFILKCTDTTTT